MLRLGAQCQVLSICDNGLRFRVQRFLSSLYVELLINGSRRALWLKSLSLRRRAYSLEFKFVGVGLGSLVDAKSSRAECAAQPLILFSSCGFVLRWAQGYGVKVQGLVSIYVLATIGQQSI